MMLMHSISKLTLQTDSNTSQELRYPQLWKATLIQVISDTKQERDTHLVSQIHVVYLVHLAHNLVVNN